MIVYTKIPQTTTFEIHFRASILIHISRLSARRAQLRSFAKFRASPHRCHRPRHALIWVKKQSTSNHGSVKGNMFFKNDGPLPYLWPKHEHYILWDRGNPAGPSTSLLRSTNCFTSSGRCQALAKAQRVEKATKRQRHRADLCSRYVRKAGLWLLRYHQI